MSHPLLVTADELPLYGMSDEFVQKFTRPQVAVALQAATDDAVGRMKPAVVPPLISWPALVKQKCAAIAIYELRSLKGLAPTQAAVGDENVLLRAEAARKWFDEVGDGEHVPDDLIDSKSDAVGTRVVDPASNTPRGW